MKIAVTEFIQIIWNSIVSCFYLRLRLNYYLIIVNANSIIPFYSYVPCVRLKKTANWLTDLPAGEIRHTPANKKHARQVRGIHRIAWDFFFLKLQHQPHNQVPETATAHAKRSDRLARLHLQIKNNLERSIGSNLEPAPEVYFFCLKTDSIFKTKRQFQRPLAKQINRLVGRQTKQHTWKRNKSQQPVRRPEHPTTTNFNFFLMKTWRATKQLTAIVMQRPHMMRSEWINSWRNKPQTYIKETTS